MTMHGQNHIKNVRIVLESGFELGNFITWSRSVPY